MKATSHKTGSVALAIVGAAIGVTVLASCSLAEAALSPLKQDAWSVTYEINVEGQTESSLAEVSYANQEKRGKEPKMGKTESVRVQPVAPGWSADAIIDTTNTATVRAVPEDGLVAHCRILLDGENEIASAYGLPGEEVECSVETPEFD
ncbi:hypothetical protein [Leucobacter chinensis]|uniref:hypothetical protein n=1 Tax=Leucobacter chinensis TaxID=2851010 RepID=UPI001C225FD5|nr:hypothetical protein [Leucobacter chinensis]